MNAMSKTKTAKSEKAGGKALKRVIVGLGTCGMAAGAKEVYAAFQSALSKVNSDASLGKTGCIGLCYREVIVDIYDASGKRSYANVTPDMVPRIVQEDLAEGQPIEEWLLDEDEFLSGQRRIVLRNCGIIDPESIQDYIERDGYRALRKALKELTPGDVISMVKESGLRGRGGAGFPTGLKWEFTANAPGDKKYMICNADEGDPGAFMDRSVLEGDPHAVIEGMAIAGYAIGADEGIIYCRAEYPLAIERLTIAIEQARESGFLGRRIFGSDFSFDVRIKEGAGAFVCGEETALIASIEGRRGMPRVRPPFPATSGLWGKPTCINNVETLANISWIILNGPEAYAEMGTEKSKGTKVFALTGKVKRSGLVEVPMGTTLREIIFKIGGGIKDGGEFKAVQIGGPTGGCLPEELLDTPVDYDSLTGSGATMGSGGMVVADRSTCMVDLAKFFMSFAQRESCGKCVPCRIGTKRMLETLTRITEGEGSEGDLELLEGLARDVKASSLCALGGTAPNPVLSTLRYFKDEYREHVVELHCRATTCAKLTVFAIDEKLCTGCGICKRSCPTGAISGKKKEPYAINQALCTRCGACARVCPFGAVIRS